MTIINCTPHSVLIASETIEPSGMVPRVSSSEPVVIGSIGNIPVFSNPTFGAVTGLPEPVEGVYLIVSKMVADACPNRKDLLLGYGAIRDEKGNIVGMRGVTIPNQ